MAYLEQFGSYLPARIVTNAELASRLGGTAEWIRDVSGICERRFAADDETLEDLAVAAGRNCLEKAGVCSASVGMLIVTSGSAQRRFPGPASAVAARLGIGHAPAIDLPVASAGSLFGLSLADHLAPAYGRILVIATERMSNIAMREPLDRTISILFGDGAGACLVSAEKGVGRVLDSDLRSDGAFAADLELSHEGLLSMNGRSVIMQASRKIPAGIREVLERNQVAPAEVEIYLMHQANQNLIDRAAKALGVPNERFYSNIARYGNTSSASMLIAASEWWELEKPAPGKPVCFAGFGAGFHWGALLAVTGP